MRVQVELREHGTEQAHLKAVATPRLPQAPDAERASESDQRRVDVVSLALGEHVGVPEEDVAVVRIEARLSLIGEERPEEVVVREDDALGGAVIDGRPLPAVALVTAVHLS